VFSSVLFGAEPECSPAKGDSDAKSESGMPSPNAGIQRRYQTGELCTCDALLQARACSEIPFSTVGESAHLGLMESNPTQLRPWCCHSVTIAGLLT
jgi:hypothetical protein